MNKFFAFGLIIILFPAFITAQQVVVKKSEIIETIDGKLFYMHFIKQGETLFEIAKVYGIQVEDIYTNNPASKAGIKTGQILKIPYAPIEKNKQVNETDYFIHVVKSKETLYGLAKKYGTTTNEILSLNPGINESVKEGQSIKIPGKYKQVDSEINQQGGKELKHTVKAGETLFAISKLYDVSVYDIKKANPGLTESLKVGQEIVIPGKDPSQFSQAETRKNPSGQRQGTTHVVVAGETFYSIAKKYAVDPDSLMKYNPTVKGTLAVGVILYIPEKSRDNNYIYYTAEKNDKLQGIAEKFGVSYSEILALNPDLQKKINKGQKVKVPVKAEETEIKQPESLVSEETTELIASCNNSRKNMESTYNVALMLPLFLEEVDSLESSLEIAGTEFNDIASFKFIQFYEGFMMAVDSMNKTGLKMNLHVYDVDNSSWKVSTVLNKSELENMDLIIGPFYAESFKKMAEFAGNNNIKIVNPLSTREEIINGNPNVFKLKPSASYQAEVLADFILQQHDNDNIIIVRQNRYKFQEEASYIKNYLNNQRYSGSSIKNKDLLYILDSLKTDKILSDNTLITKDKVARNLSESTYVSNPVKEIVLSEDSANKIRLSLSHLRNNFIIVLSEEKVFCADLMSRLNKFTENYKITLFGFPEWRKFDDLETQYLLNMNTHFFVPAMVNYNDPRIRKWIERFRKTYSTEPSMELYALDGFDAGWYFLNALFRYGKDFENCLSVFDIQLIQTQFKFEHLKGNGYQNTYWNIGRHFDYQFIPTTQ